MGIIEKIKKPKKAKSETTKAVSTESKKTYAMPVGADDVIVRPHVTEKAAVLGATQTYVFVVKKSANRIQVKNAITMMYGVKPVSVRIANVIGKHVRYGRSLGKRSDWKKAIVTLPKGKSINVHEGV